MNNFKKEIKLWPSKVAIIGGGRWARVLIEVLCEMIPNDVELSIHTPHNAAFMRAWCDNLNWEGEISVSEGLPQSTSLPTAIIVANAARDHEKSIMWALSRSLPVLVEKPIATTSTSAQRLITMAQKKRVRFASAHVFLFASYLENFANIIKKEDEGVKCLKIIWTDPKSEHRYGEQKQYDPGLSVFADCLPHIISIFSSLSLGLPESCSNLKFLNGGSNIELELKLDDILCQVQLVRNAEKRQRIIEVTTKKKIIKLDFTIEPGIIFSGATKISADSDWDTNPRPVARLLTAFSQWAAGGDYDHRLNINIGLRANQIIDQAVSLYDFTRVSWLIEKLSSKETSNADFRYALTEILSSEKALKTSTLERRIECITKKMSGVNSIHLLESLNKTQNPSAIFKLILAAAQHDKESLKT